MSTFVLKIIASISMLIDHTGEVFPAPLTPEIFRGVGRIAFPLYAFMAAQGCRHTKDINKYLLRLGAFALISQIPFYVTLLFRGDSLGSALSQVDLGSFLYGTNVFYTLFLGVACVAVYERLTTKQKPLLALLPVLLIPASFSAYFLGDRRFLGYVLAGLLFQLAFLLYIVCVFLIIRRLPEMESGAKITLPRKIAALLPALPLIYCGGIFATDYSNYGVAIIFILYLAKPENRIARTVAAALCVAYMYGPGFLRHAAEGVHSAGFMYLAFALSSVIAIFLYNGKQGRKIKWAFYWFYPVHIAILGIVYYVF